MKISSAELGRSAYRPDQLVRDDRPQVAFVGRSNVGKSSLLNRLLGRRKLARTSSTPGRTRAVHYFLVNQRFYFVDLPGYGFAKASRTDREEWAKLIQAYLEQPAGPRTAVQLVDAKVGPTVLDEEAIDYLRTYEVWPMIVATKADRVKKSKRAAAEREVRSALKLEEEWPVLMASSTTGEGISRIWSEIEAFLDERRQEART